MEFDRPVAESPATQLFQDLPAGIGNSGPRFCVRMFRSCVTCRVRDQLPHLQVCPWYCGGYGGCPCLLIVLDVAGVEVAHPNLSLTMDLVRIREVKATTPTPAFRIRHIHLNKLPQIALFPVGV